MNIILSGSYIFWIRHIRKDSRYRFWPADLISSQLVKSPSTSYGFWWADIASGYNIWYLATGIFLSSWYGDRPPDMVSGKPICFPAHWLVFWLDVSGCLIWFLATWCGFGSLDMVSGELIIILSNWDSFWLLDVVYGCLTWLLATSYGFVTADLGSGHPIWFLVTWYDFWQADTVFLNLIRLLVPWYSSWALYFDFWPPDMISG